MEYLSSFLVLGVLGGVLAVLLVIANKYLCTYGPCTVTINDREPFSVDGGGKLLEALYERKIFIPSACGGQATCGFCKVVVNNGGGPVLPTELPFLSATEEKNGTRLACQVKIKNDIVIHVKPEFLDVKQFSARVAAAQLKTHDTRELALDLIEPNAMAFKPGQYVQVFVPDQPETTFRAYSVNSSPAQPSRIELLVRLIPGGLGSSYLHSVQPGDELSFTGPYGEFVLDPADDSTIICVAGGCGMAPIRSIVHHLRDTKSKKRCLVFFGGRTAQDLLYREEYAEISRSMPNLQAFFAVSEPHHSPEWKGETGFIHLALDKHLGSPGKCQAFLCGPPLMIKAVTAVLNAHCVPRDTIFYDEF